MLAHKPRRALPRRGAFALLTAVLTAGAAMLAVRPAVTDDAVAPRGIDSLYKPVKLDLEGDWKAQYDQLARQLGEREKLATAFSQALRPEATLLPGDRDGLDVVVRRTAALLADLRRLAPAQDFTAEQAELDELERHMHIVPLDGPDRYELYLRACRLRRRIAFANPLLDFREILFIHRSGAASHMCDQYFGHRAPPGGLYVLRDAFSDRPSVRDVLAQSTVQRGRMTGQKLTGGFLSPELSFDATTVLFAHADRGEAEKWSEQRSFHLFRVNLDGSGLEQLTDGPENDFDPCFLPNGRVVFISERRGGFGRCHGRPVPTYTLHSMNPDGSDIQCLSFHETNEWHPSVNHDGMIVYTRWDYVDRDTNVAHHPWITTPDGRDPRALHGNYPTDRASRPWMEMDVRAIPGSRRYVATAAAHHGPAYGSLVVFDPDLPDDDAMGPVRRVTPEVLFPESERGPRAYSSPWPLSEDYYLCVFDADAGRHGIYLVDSFGNKELLYRDARASALSPIPLAPRPVPPVIPTPAPAATETFAVMNVYDALLGWPEGTNITALRVIQVLPKTTWHNRTPRIGIGSQTNARAVLGTVPVEPDGSAYFHVPPGKAVYFQALDEHGMAVQSMRSATYLHPGERLTCQGCHEPRRASPPIPAGVPMALRREPSYLQPDVDGSNPFSYPRLVQPVLDAKCVGCHEQKGGKAPNLKGGTSGWYPSYESLARKYGFYFHSGNGSIRTGEHGGARTTPGQFGARASKLMEVIDGPAHKGYGLELTPQERHRIVLWLDCNSDFYGAYENTEAQSRGEIVHPSLD